MRLDASTLLKSDWHDVFHTLQQLQWSCMDLERHTSNEAGSLQEVASLLPTLENQVLHLSRLLTQLHAHQRLACPNSSLPLAEASLPLSIPTEETPAAEAPPCSSLSELLEQLQLEIDTYQQHYTAYEVQCVIEDASPPLASVSLSPYELKRILQNLFNNAIDALEQRFQQSTQSMPQEPWQGKITVLCLALETNLVIAVSDNGIGMNEEVLARCCEEAFSTKPPSERPEQWYHGLGLSTVRQLVEEQAGGRLEIQSVSLLGSTFTMSFDYV
ncbi:MAG: ATP-binding protein [Vampirovibrionales bacterium]